MDTINDNRYPKVKGVLLLFAFALIGVFATGVIALFISDEEVRIKNVAWIQNILMWIAPTFIVAYIVSRKPFGFLRINKTPHLADVCFAIAISLAMMPVMNWLVVWNESMSLPEFLRPMEEWMRAQENHAQQTTDRLIACNTLWQLLLTVASVGVLTGIGEEIFFRGGLQQILKGGGLNGHMAVWISSLVFSGMHFQFYGFFPRLMLGVYFGYAFLLTRNIWIPILCHAFNNSVVVISNYLVLHKLVDVDMQNYGADSNLSIVMSVLVTASLIYYWKKQVDRRTNAV